MWKLFDKIRRTPLATVTGPVLVPAPAGARGVPALHAGAGEHPEYVELCPAEAVSYQGGEWGLDLTRCTWCGLCAEAYPEAFTQTSRYALATRAKATLLSAAAPAVDPADAEAQALAREIHDLLGRSLHIRHVDAGSCNGCDGELTHLLNPVYDLQRFGIDFVASPRHADLLLVTGGVTRNLELALRRTFDAAGEPKLVVAIGTCAIGGGVIGQTYAHKGGVDQIVPVTVYVPGCPPRPEAILHGILLAISRAQEQGDI